MDLSRVAALLEHYGETVTLRRITDAATQTGLDVCAKAVVRGYRAEELVGGIIQGDASITISDAEICAAGWPGPPLRDDKLFRAAADGSQIALNVQTVDTRRVGDRVALHVLQVRG